MLETLRQEVDAWIVLQRLLVSFTCCVVRRTGTWYWLTRESGQLPAKCDLDGEEEDECEVCSLWRDETVAPAKSYLCIGMIGEQEGTIDSLVGFSAFCERSVDVVLGTILPQLREVWMDDGEGTMQEEIRSWRGEVFGMFYALHNGTFSSVKECECLQGVICVACKGVQVEECLFFFFFFD